jgi:hypothetical protein
MIINVGGKICGATNENVGSGIWQSVHCTTPEAAWGDSITITRPSFNNMLICGIKVFGRSSNQNCEFDIPMDSILTPSSSCTVDKFGVAKYEGCFDDDQNFDQTYTRKEWVLGGSTDQASFVGTTSIMYGYNTGVTDTVHSFADNMIALTASPD